MPPHLCQPPTEIATTSPSVSSLYLSSSSPLSEHGTNLAMKPRVNSYRLSTSWSPRIGECSHLLQQSSPPLSLSPHPKRPPLSSNTKVHRKSASLSSLFPSNKAIDSSSSLCQTTATEQKTSSEPITSSLCSASPSDMDVLRRLQDGLASCQKKYGDTHYKTGLVYNLLGNWYFRHHEYNDACLVYQRAIHCTAPEDSLSDSRSSPLEHLHAQHMVVADALANLGTVYWTTGDLTLARSVLEQAGEKYAFEAETIVAGGKSSPNPMLLANANVQHQLGLTYSLEQDFAKALACLEQAKSMRQQVARPDLVSKTLDAMGQVCCLMQDFPAALQYFNSALTLPSVNRSLTLENMAWVHAQCGDTDKALAVYQDLLQDRRNLYIRTPCREVALKLAKVFAINCLLCEHLGQVDMAKKMLGELHSLANVENIQPQEIGLENFPVFSSLKNSTTISSK